MDEKQSPLCILAAGILLILAALLIPSPVAANDGKNLIYANDFSIDPFTSEGGWKTNSQNSYNWDFSNKALHYRMIGATAAYAYVPVEFPLDSCFIEYDVTPVTTDKDTAFRFGLGDHRMDITRGPILISSFYNERSRNLMALSVITQNNNKVEVTSRGESYGGSTTEFTGNTTYHVIIAYNKPGRNVSMKVIDKSTGLQIWGYYVALGSELTNINRLLLTTVGDYSTTGGYAEGYIDNLEMYQLRAVTLTPTEIPATPTPKAVLTTRPPTTKPIIRETTPSPTPTKSPLGIIAVISGILVAMAVIRSRQ
jgi:hypothetical protein